MVVGDVTVKTIHANNITIFTGAVNLGRLNTVLPSPPNLDPKMEYNALFVLIWSGCPLYSKYPLGMKFPANNKTDPKSSSLIFVYRL